MYAGICLGDVPFIQFYERDREVGSRGGIERGTERCDRDRERLICGIERRGRGVSTRREIERGTERWNREMDQKVGSGGRMERRAEMWDLEEGSRGETENLQGLRGGIERGVDRMDRRMGPGMGSRGGIERHVVVKGE